MESEEHPCFRASTSSARNVNEDEEETTVKLNESHELDKTDEEPSETSKNELNIMAEEKQRSPSGDSADRPDDDRKKKDSRDVPAANDDRDSPERKKRNSQEAEQLEDIPKETTRSRRRKMYKMRKKAAEAALLEDRSNYYDSLNKVSVILEICQDKHWPLPQYELLKKEVFKQVNTSSHVFTMACSVLKFREVASAGTKKVAKNLAALKMWERLQSEPQLDLLVQPCISKTNDETTALIIRSRFSELKEGSISTQSDEYSEKVSQFLDLMKKTSGEALKKLQHCLTSKGIDYVSRLQEIATEHKFEVTYEDIMEETYSGLCQCLVQLQLTTLPITVCQGTGVTHNDAQSDAAKNALEYLKIMTRKLSIRVHHFLRIKMTTGACASIELSHVMLEFLAKSERIYVVD